jgi:hypothetical protein
VLILTDLLPRYDKINLPEQNMFSETLHSIFNCNGALPGKIKWFKGQNKLLQQSLFTKSKLKYNRSIAFAFFRQSGFSKSPK